MLVLTRRTGQTIHIGTEIVVQLAAIRIGRVRVGIRAPRHISIDRPETRAARQEMPRPEDFREPHSGVGLLVLSRRPGERILIGDAIEVWIIGVRGAGVEFGVIAPRNVTVDRGEVYLRKLAESEAIEEAYGAADVPASRIQYRRRRTMAGA